MSSSTKGARRRPAAGYAPGDIMYETAEFANQLKRRRAKNKAAKASRRRNRQ